MATLFAIIGLAIAGGQFWAARAANKQAQLAQAAADEQRLSDDKRFALAICEPLATPEVHAILGMDSPPEEDIAFLNSQFELCKVKSTSLLSAQVKNDTRITVPIRRVMDPVQTFLERVGMEVDTADLDTKLGKTESSKYSWAGEGSYSKIRTINRIAHRWAEEQKLTTRDAFEESFGAELRAAVPSRADEFQATYLLTTDSEKNTLDGLLLVLDGAPCGIHWRCGFKNTRIGFEVHKPIIEYFATKHRYPAVGL